MSDTRLIVVTGATGAQGGGLARAILADSDGFALRAVTRDPDTERARALAEAGAEVVRGDLDDRGSLEEAFGGAWGAYCVTNFWEHFSPEKERVQARNMAEAARAAKLGHVVWSTLEDTRRWMPLDDDRMPTLMGHYKVPHFDGKGEADQEFGDRGVPTTFLLTSFYWDNLIHFGLGPKRGPDGRLVLAMPMGDARLPGIAAEDIGLCAYGIFRRGGEYIGRRIGIAGGHLTGKEMAEALATALGEPVDYDAMAPEDFRALGFPGADDLGNMFQFKRDFNEDFCRVRSVEESRKLNPGLQSFEEWLGRNRTRIPLG